MGQLSHPYITTGKTIALTIRTFVGKLMSMLYNTPSRFVITFLPRRESGFYIMVAVTIHGDFGAQENKICHCLHFSSSICHEVIGLDAMTLVFWMLNVKPAFSLSSFAFIKRHYSSSLSSIRVMLSAYLKPSVQFSCSVISDSLRPHESQNTRPPCPSQIPRVYSNSCSSSRWCHTAISSSVVPFSSCPKYLPASGFSPMSQHFPWGGQSIGVSASALVLPMNIQDWSPLGWTGWISLQSKGLSRVFSNTTVQKHQFFGAQLSS